METTVLIIGAGPAGLAMSVCLKNLSISNIILEKENCHASLWKQRAYDRLHLHLAKEFCELPFMSHLPETPTFMSRSTFVEYIDKYVREFNLCPMFGRSVFSAFFDENLQKWVVDAKNSCSGEGSERFVAKFLVIATGENAKPYIPNVCGIDSFPGIVVHSSEYICGACYEDKNVLVVGCGNSGMEICFDLSNNGAKTSIVIRNPVHIVTKEMIHRGMTLLNYLPMNMIDESIVFQSTATFGDLSQFGISRPSRGPFYQKFFEGKSPVLDVGTISKIRDGKIKVFPEIINVNQDIVEFKDGTQQKFDAIVFATGYRSAANNFLKDFNFIFNEDGMPKNPLPNHWKGENRIYCVGFARNGIFGIAKDAKVVAKDIKANLSA